MAVLLSFLFVFRESDLIALTEEPESEAENAEDRALGSSSDAPPTASDSPRPRFQDRCLEVAAAFELSPKETEVMILFAKKSPTLSRIQEELFISKGTVSTIAATSTRRWTSIPNRKCSTSSKASRGSRAFPFSMPSV